MTPVINSPMIDPAKILSSNTGPTVMPIDPRVTGEKTVISAPDDAVPTQFSNYKSSQADKDKVDKIVAIWNSLDLRWRNFYIEVMRNFEYLVDNQLTPEVKATLKDEERPELIFNFLLSLVNYIAGTIANNKFAMKADPIRQGDEQLADMHTVLNEWAMQNCDGDYEIAKAAVTACIAKIGWTNNYWDITGPDGGKWITRSVDPFMIRMDPDTKQEDLSDCRYVGMQGFYAAEEIIKMYKLSPEVVAKIRKNSKFLEGQAAKDDNKPIGWIDRIFGGAVEWWNPNRTNRSDGFYGDQTAIDAWMDSRVGIYRVVEFHDKRWVIQAKGFDVTNGQTVDVDSVTANNPQLYSEFKAAHPNLYFFEKGHFEVWITAICPRLVPDQPILEMIHPIQGAGFQFKPIFWYAFHPDFTKTRGVMDNLISSQDFFNQRMMSYLEAIMRGVNPDWHAKKGSILPEDMSTWTSKARGKIKEYTGDEPQREHPMQEVLSSLSGSAEMILELRKDLSGISPNSLGMAENADESGTLFNQRVQAGLTMLSQAFSHIQRSMTHIYVFCDRNLQKFVTLPRAVRILGEPPAGLQGVQVDPSKKNAYWLQINQQTVDGVLNDVTQGQYDFKPDQAQLGQTAKQAKFQMGMEFLKSVPPMYAEAVAPIIARNFDSPDAKEISDRMEQVFSEKYQITAQTAQTQLLGQQAQVAGAVKQLHGPAPEEVALAQTAAKQQTDAAKIAQEQQKQKLQLQQQSQQ